ncbi:transcriptional regulator [Clostridia bacterium]|nr:transcriptional regulator [Clostridia bacterium]
MSEKFSDRLKRLRTSNRLSQKTLGEIIGLKPSAIKEMEHGRITTTLERAAVIADYFNVSLDYLVVRAENPEPNK